VKRASLFAAAAVAVLGAGSLGFAGPVAGGVVERDQVDVAPARGVPLRAVQLDNRYGHVEVRGHDEPGVRMIAVKRAPDERTMDRLKVSLVPDPAGRILIQTALLAADEARPVSAGALRVDLLVFVPRSARVDAVTWKGNIALEKLDRGAEATTNEGDIDVNNCAGEIRTHAAQGAQRFSTVFGELEADGLRGAIVFNLVTGRRLGARLHNGQIVARRVRVHEVDLRTTAGDITFAGTLSPNGTVRIASYRGNVEVTFVRGTGFRLEVASRRGAIETEGLDVVRNSRRVVGTFGGGRRTAGVFVSTHLGDVKVGLAHAGESL
jgi:hypothetical protein